MVKRPRRTVEKWGWMTTYSDMVTLLLCFFVLLYASSTFDRDKWEVLVRSLNPSASLASSVINEASLGEETQLFDQLHLQMQRYVENNDLADDIEVLGGDGYAFIVFKNNIFFDGDSYVLKPGGRQILDVLGSGVSPIGESIKEMRILGHTNQADPNRQNDTRGDRFLASNRATEVLVYLQDMDIIEPRKLVGIGYGQFYPVAPFVREEDRLQNRRVEILITEVNAVDITLEQIYSRIETR